jgi:glycine hydroxymethyltransferase
MHVIAAKAVCFKEAMEPEFKSYQAQILKNANTMCQVFQERGVEIVSKGTKNHMFLVDLINKSITGKDVEETLGRANITLNKNAVPNDPQSRFVTSGLRIGTPAVTTRGFKEDEVSIVASWICDILKDLENEAEINRVKSEVKNLCAQFPVYSFKY